MVLGNEFLRERPETRFFGSIPQGTPAFSRFFSNRFNPVFNQFQGELGRQALSGEDPTLSFEDFLGNFDWINQYFGTPRRERGFFPGRLAPPARFLPNF